MARQEGHEMFRHANGPHAWATAPVGNGEGFVEVQVTHVRANHARAGESHLRIHVGAIHVHLPTVGVDHGRHVEHR